MMRQLACVFFTSTCIGVTDALGIQKQTPNDNSILQAMDQDESDLLTDTFVEKPTSFIFTPIQRKPVMWVHIHKMAGTFMCVTAGRANENVVTPNDGTCNSLALHDAFFPDALATAPAHTSCDYRADYFAQNNFTWGQIEREVSTGDFCKGDFVYGIMLRETMSRLTSYVNWNTLKVNSEHYREFMTCIENQNSTMCPQKPGQNVKEQRNFGYQEYDNFAVRVLAGYDVMLLPPGGVNSTHLEVAVKLLEQFSIVLPLERMDTASFQSQMDKVMGWHIKRKNQPARKNTHKIFFSDDDVVRFTAINKYDIELYAKFAERQ